MRWLILSLALVSYVAAARSSEEAFHIARNEVDDQGADEQKLVLPAFPKEESMVQIKVDGGLAFDFFVDLESVSMVPGGIVRYTLLARSERGAVNITYEGIKCKGRERKFYAYGRKDRTWTLAHNPQWNSISNSPRDLAQATLHDAYFCPGWTMVRDTAEAKRVLKDGGNPQAGGWSGG